MKEKLLENLKCEYKNHLMPFFWQHGDDDETILSELHRIYRSGIGGVCIESRVHPDFMGKEWFDDIRLILAECRKLGMKVWLLDDRCYPTGVANYEIRDKYPHLGKRALTERHMDVVGPVKEGAALYETLMGQPGRLFGIVACEREAAKGQKMTGRTIDLSGNTRDGVVFFDLPEGYWRIFVIFEIDIKDNYIDMLRKESVDVLINAVYEPHYREFKEYYGNTFEAYFTDESFILANARLPLGEENSSKGVFPWNENVFNMLTEKYGENLLAELPKLWFPSNNQAKIRLDYMDTVTKLYRECFSYRLGNWCRERGVMYVGHIVEDNDYHTKLRSAAHFFRSLDGQDMAGIDVVLCQIVPGMTDNTIAVPCAYDIADHEFFHFGLAKLGSSHAHIQPEKQGRAMCEIFGAYGWAEGLPMMKWLSDHMLVRGINEFVPHAFSSRYPNPDCPPHFYALGNNPEYRGFKLLMDYLNRVCEILSGGIHHATCAILYHAEAEWSGGKYMKFEKVAKLLTEAQLDFDVVSADYVADAVMENGKMKLAGEEYPVIIVPYAQVLPRSIINNLTRAEKAGIKVIFINAMPEYDELQDAVSFEKAQVIPLDGLTAYMKEGFADLKAVGENTKYLRYYHYSKGDTHCVMLTNEGINGKVCADITLKDFSGGNFVKYYPMENEAYTCNSEGTIHVEIDEYNSLMLFFGDVPSFPEEPKNSACEMPLEAKWKISFAESVSYDPVEYPEAGVFENEKPLREFYNIAKENPRFAGFVKYETELNLTEGTYRLDLGDVGETAKAFVNEKPCGDRIIPPYSFEFKAEKGENKITVITASHIAYKVRDVRSSPYLTLMPVGIQGPVKLYKVK